MKITETTEFSLYLIVALARKNVYDFEGPSQLFGATIDHPQNKKTVVLAQSG
jgi:hypothetical protein